MILHLDRDILTVGLEQVSLSGAERCVYRTAALHDAGAAEDKGLVREVVVLLPLQRALRAGSHNAQGTLDQAWLRHSACSGAEET